MLLLHAVIPSLQQPNSVDSHPPRFGEGISTGKPMADVRRKSTEKAKKVFLTIADMMAGDMLIYFLHYPVQFFEKKNKNLNMKI